MSFPKYHSSVGPIDVIAVTVAHRSSIKRIRSATTTLKAICLNGLVRSFIGSGAIAVLACALSLASLVFVMRFFFSDGLPVNIRPSQSSILPQTPALLYGWLA